MSSRCLFAVTLALWVAVGVKPKTELIQSPAAMKVREGDTVQIRCVLNSTNVKVTVEKYIVRWYNSPDKLTQRRIVLRHYINGRVYRKRGFSKRFQLSRDMAHNSYVLTISNVTVEDSDNYICGIWDTLFGIGTKLNVTSVNVPVLIQSPSLERITEGHTARFCCAMRNAWLVKTDVHWYQKLPGQGLEWVLTHEAGGATQRRANSPERFKPSRDVSNSSFILMVSDVEPSDSAVYYCVVWGDISGNGTRLIVTGLDDKSPSNMIGIITACLLFLGVLFCILATAVCYLKKWACFQHRFKPDESSTEDLKTISATIAADRKENKDAAADVSESEKSEIHYADVQFHRRTAKDSTVRISEETTEYAVIQRA